MVSPSTKCVFTGGVLVIIYVIGIFIEWLWETRRGGGVRDEVEGWEEEGILKEKGSMKETFL